MAYISSLDRKRDYSNTIAYAKKEGIAEGIEKGERKKAIELALKFKKMGISIADISKGTGLTVEEIEKLK